MRSFAAIALVVSGGSACGRIAFDGRSDAVGGGTDVAMPDSLDDDLVFYLPMNDPDASNLIDRVGALPATCSAAACPVSGPGAIGTAMQFDGVDDCLTIADAPQLRPAAFTLALRVRHDVADNDSIVAKLVGPIAGQENSFQLETGVTAGAFYTDATVIFSMSNGMGNGNVFLATGSDLTIGVFHHAAATFDGLTRRVYIDGIERAMGAGTIAYDVGAMTIGCDQNVVNQQYFTGVMEELRLYRRALTAAEIATFQ